MLEIARQKVAESGLDNLSFEQATIERLESPKGEWDAVLAMSVLYLLDNRGAALAAASRYQRKQHRLAVDVGADQEGGEPFAVVQA